MNDEIRHDDNLANKADWLEELIVGLISDVRKADGTTIHLNTALVSARPGTKKHALFSKIKITTGV